MNTSGAARTLEDAQKLELIHADTVPAMLSQRAGGAENAASPWMEVILNGRELSSTLNALLQLGPESQTS
jgi:hypothetical protein